MFDYINIYDWYSENILDNSTGKSEFKIFIFGKNIKQESTCIIVNKFTPFFYIKVPHYWSKQCKIKCNGSCCCCFLKNIKKKYLPSVDFKYNCEKKKMFRGFNNDKKFRFIKVIFTNTYDMRKFINVFEKKTFQLEIILKSLEKINGFTDDSKYMTSSKLKIYNSKTKEYNYIDNEDIMKIQFIKKKNRTH